VTSLQPRSQQTQAVAGPSPHLDKISALVTEDKDVTGEWIFGQSSLHLGSQAIESAAYVSYARRNPNAYARRQCDRWRSRAKTVRIEPEQPQQNGLHERVHLTLKRALGRPPGANLKQKQRQMDGFRQYNSQQRPPESSAL